MLENDLGGFGNEYGVSGSVSRLKEKQGNNWSWSERAYQSLALKALGDRPKDLARRWTFYAMLPNLGVDVYPDCLDFFQILPLGAKKAKIRTMVYGHPDKSREMRLLRYLNGRINGQVAREDFELCHRVQQGLETHGYELGPLSSYETGVREFHDLVRASVPAATLAEEPLPGELPRINAEMKAEEPA
jgi:phenylpropionate dioxygenase-like ring-hydroxylating dioxygenase large terminal subunit